MGIKIYKNGAWADASGVKIYKNGAWVNAKAVKVYKNGAWVDVWTDYNPNLPSVSFPNTHYLIPAGDPDPHVRGAQVTTLAKLQEAVNAGFTNLSYTASVTINALGIGHVKLGMGVNTGGNYDEPFGYAEAGTRGDGIGSPVLTQTIERTLGLSWLINQLTNLTDKNLYLRVYITQTADYAIYNLDVSGSLTNIRFT